VELRKLMHIQSDSSTREGIISLYIDQTKITQQMDQPVLMGNLIYQWLFRHRYTSRLYATIQPSSKILG
jgi:hypothetical protein